MMPFVPLFNCGNYNSETYLVGGTIHAKGKSMPLQNRLDNVKAQAAAARVPTVGVIDTVKRLKYLLQVGAVNGYAAVSDLQCVLCQLDTDFRLRWRMSNRIANDIGYRLLQQGHIAPASTTGFNLCLKILLPVLCGSLPKFLYSL